MFYATNTFRICMVMADLLTVARWLVHVGTKLGSTLFTSFTMELVHPSWVNFQKFFPFFETIRASGLEYHALNPKILVRRRRPVRLHNASIEALALGQRAYAEV